MGAPRRPATRWLAGAATVPLVLAGLALTTAGSADAAAPCTHPAWSDKDNGGSGTGLSSSTSVRTGPSHDCAEVASVGTNVTLWYHCYVTNSVGNTWTNVRIAGTNIDGWVSDDELDNHGSLFHC
jgi:hypothetical protein